MNAFDIPPFAYRMMSTNSIETIVSKSCLSKSTVARLSLLKSWDSVRIGVARTFITGTGFSMDRPPLTKWQTICLNGLDSLTHLRFRYRDKPWQRGAKANRIKAIRKTLS